MDLRHNDNAERAWREAVRLDPKWAGSWDGLGLIALRRGDFVKTIEHCDQALALAPNMMDSMVNRGMAYLAFRRWPEGWDGYRRNLGLNKDRKERIYGSEPRWEGQRGLNIVVYGEQGIGDELTFASVIPDLIQCSESVVIECDMRLEGLFKRSFPACEVYGTRYKNAHPWSDGRSFDARVAMGDLPAFFRNDTESFTRTPYLKASPEMRLQWRALLDSMGPKPKIGLSWTGGINETGKERRSLKLEQLLPLLKCDVDFISLQYLDPTEELEQLEETHGIKVHHWSWAHAQDYDQTAALVAELDLVISVTTTVALTAGALGKECWVLVPERPIWMYCTEGEFPWFDLKLFRQNGKWPVDEISDKLKEKYARPAG